MDPYHPHPHTPTLVKQSMKSGQVKELHCQERLFGKNVNVTTISASENGAVEASQGPFLSNTLRSQTTSAHARLVERLQERKNLLPIAPSECSRLVMKVFDHLPCFIICCCISVAAADNARGSLRVDNGPD